MSTLAAATQLAIDDYARRWFTRAAKYQGRVFFSLDEFALHAGNILSDRHSPTPEVIGEAVESMTPAERTALRAYLAQCLSDLFEVGGVGTPSSALTASPEEVKASLEAYHNRLRNVLSVLGAHTDASQSSVTT